MKQSLIPVTWTYSNWVGLEQCINLLGKDILAFACTYMQKKINHAFYGGN